MAERSTLKGQPKERRKTIRRPLQGRTTQIELGNQTFRVKVADLSEGGARLIAPPRTEIFHLAQINIFIQRLIPRINARVLRLVQSPTETEMGVKFESLMMEPRTQDNIQALLDAWQQVSLAYSTYDSFSQILGSIDNEILEGKTAFLPEAFFGISHWLEKRVGPLAIWGIFDEGAYEDSINVLAETEAAQGLDFETRRRNVAQIAARRMTGTLDGRPHIFGGTVLMEFFGNAEGKMDLLQRMAFSLGQKLPFWNRLQMKMIALELLGDEMSRHSRA